MINCSSGCDLDVGEGEGAAQVVDRCPVQSQGVKLAPPGGQGGGPRHKKQGLRWQAVLTQVAKEWLLVGQTYEMAQSHSKSSCQSE